MHRPFAEVRSCRGDPYPGCSARAPGLLAGAELGEDAEGRLPDRQLVELRVDAAELVDAVLVAGIDLDAAHRQRLPLRLDGAEAAAAAVPLLRLAQQVQVDLDGVDLLHAADVGVPPRLVGVEEGAGTLDARGRIDDLVAVDAAAAALRLVLRTERERGRGGRLFRVHVGILRFHLVCRKT